MAALSNTAASRSLPRILEKIRATKEVEISALCARTSEADLREKALAANAPRDFYAAITQPFSSTHRVGVNLIAEVKKASPSKGLIRPDFDPPAIARAYQEGGAAAISCLTDKDYFQGSLAYLVAVRAAVTLPVLRKDFLIHPSQVLEARAAGADAVLLIARMLDADMFQRLHDLTRELGMTALCEIHDEPDMEKTLAIKGLQLVGINSRDLDTFVVDVDGAFRLRELISSEIPVVGESGIFTPDDMRRLRDGGFVAALVGESLMRQPDVALATRTLLTTPSL